LGLTDITGAFLTPQGHITFNYAGTSSLTIQTSTFAGDASNSQDYVNVYENGVPTNIIGYGPETVRVSDGQAGVGNLRAALDISNVLSQTAIILDDSPDTAVNTAHMGTIPSGAPGRGYITGLSPFADIHYVYAE